MAEHLGVARLMPGAEVRERCTRIRSIGTRPSVGTARARKFSHGLSKPKISLTLAPRESDSEGLTTAPPYFVRVTGTLERRFGSLSVSQHCGETPLQGYLPNRTNHRCLEKLFSESSKSFTEDISQRLLRDAPFHHRDRVLRDDAPYDDAISPSTGPTQSRSPSCVRDPLD